MNPFMAFCLYVAARVFVQYLQKMPDDQEVRQSLEFLLAAMRVIQRKNPLAESFLVQLNVDIEGSGLDILMPNPDYTSRYVEGMVSSLDRLTINRHIPLQPHQFILTQLKDPNNLPSRCLPIVHISETSEDDPPPNEHRFPGDILLPKHDARKESPTLRTEDGRQQIYAFRNADVTSRIHATPRPSFPENEQSRPYLPQGDVQNKFDAHPRRFDKILTSEDWNQGSISTVADHNAFTEKDKINAINANDRHLDTEMTDQSANSRGLTPQSNISYNYSSSNTSYSPSQGHDDDQNTSGTGGRDNYMTGFAPPSHNTIFTGEGVKRAMSSSSQQQRDPFKIPAGWDIGTGMTPGTGMSPGSLTGMTPDGGWEKLMDSMGWETGTTG